MSKQIEPTRVIARALMMAKEKLSWYQAKTKGMEVGGCSDQQIREWINEAFDALNQLKARETDNE